MQLDRQLATKSAARSDRRIAARPFALLAVFVVFGALALRLWGISGGLPWVDHPDEPNPVGYVAEMLRTGDLNPHAFQKPSLYVYLLLVATRAGYLVGGNAGAPATLDSDLITTHIYTTVPEIFLWGRILTATLGALTALAALLIGSRRFGALAGALAALWLGLARFHLQHSQYVTTDVASGLLVLLAFAASLAVAHGGGWRAYLLAGALAGLSASTKYNAGIAALMVAAAHFYYWRGNAFAQLPRLVAAGAAALAGFVAGTPYALLSFTEFRDGLLGQVSAYNDGPQGDVRGAWNTGGYAEFFWQNGLLPVGCTALIGGLLLLWRRDRAFALVWLAFAIPYLLLLLAQESHFMRNLIPLLALAALPIGYASAAAAAWLQQRLPAGARAAVIPAVAAILLLPNAADTSAYAQRLGRGDTRVALQAWIDTQAPPGSRIAAELRPLPGAIESRWAAVEYLPAQDLAWYRRQGYAYLIASSDRWRQWNAPEEYAALGTPIAAFGGDHPRWMFGPRLLLFATGLTPADAPQPLPTTAAFGSAQLLGVAIGAPDPSEPTVGLVPIDSYPPHGATLALRTFWQVDAPLDRDYFIFVHVLDAAGDRVAQRDAPPWQGRFPTTAWRAGSIVVDVNDVALPPLPPGEYRVLVGMFDPVDGARPPITVDGAPFGEPAVEVARIVVRSP
jgi:4-amino-4-deoxy-L-arabinose transferase-like glycosyltransferase